MCWVHAKKSQFRITKALSESRILSVTGEMQQKNAGGERADVEQFERWREPAAVQQNVPSQYSTGLRLWYRRDRLIGRSQGERGSGGVLALFDSTPNSSQPNWGAQGRGMDVCLGSIELGNVPISKGCELHEDTPYHSTPQ